MRNFSTLLVSNKSTICSLSNHAMINHSGHVVKGFFLLLLIYTYHI